MTFCHSAQFLLQQREVDGTLEPCFWSPILNTGWTPSFFSPIQIAGPVPDTQYYVVRTIIEEDSLRLQPVENPSQDSCQLIVRINSEHLLNMKPYLLKEFEAYKKLNVQANDLLYPIGFAPLSKGCLTLFLAHNLMTLESQMNQIVVDSLLRSAKYRFPDGRIPAEALKARFTQIRWDFLASKCGETYQIRHSPSTLHIHPVIFSSMNRSAVGHVSGNKIAQGHSLREEIQRLSIPVKTPVGSPQILKVP
jgi:hypothetical protein